MGKAVALVVGSAGFGIIAGALLFGSGVQTNAIPEIRPTWTEFKWPFLLDQWGIGRAFVCKPADCGSEVKVYMRPKIGFCNCNMNTLDDHELDRVGDKELVAPTAAASAPGRPVDIAWMKGRSRIFVAADTARTEVVSVAFHDNCDLVVAVAAITPVKDAAEPAVIDFLNSERVLRWVKWLTL
jgi:hypothetical protein